MHRRRNEWREIRRRNNKVHVENRKYKKEEKEEEERVVYAGK